MIVSATRPKSGLLGRLSHPCDQKVTFIELFFDLVFVFAITQVTKYVFSDLTWAGAAEAMLLLWMIWWAWTQFAWALNPADTNHSGVRLIVLVATGVGFLMAINVPGTFAESGLWFAIPYVVIRLMGMALNAAAASQPNQRRAVRLYAILSIVPVVLIIAGALVEPSARIWLWLAAAILDIGATGIAGRHDGFSVRPAHFAERHGLIVIIALGESLIVAGQSVLATESSGLQLTVARGAVVLSSLLWWLYFGWWQEAIEQRMTARSGSLRSRPAGWCSSYSALVSGLIMPS